MARAAAAEGRLAEAKLLPPLLPRSLGGATAGEGLGCHARSQSKLLVARMSGATSLRTHSAVVKEPESPRGPGEPRRPPHRARSAACGPKAAFLRAVRLIPPWGCTEIYT